MGVPAFLIRLLDPGRLSPRVKLGPEDRICIEFANRIRVAALEGRLRCVWTHVGNEVGGGYGKSSEIRYAIARALGFVTGTPDYLFLAPDRAAVIEFKSKDGSLSENQKLFRSWCELSGVPHAVCRSAEDGVAKLREWGFLT